MRKLQKLNLRLSNLNPNTRGKKLVFVVLAAAILVAIGFALINLSTQNPDHKITQKINKFNKDDTPCQQVVKEIGDESADSKYSVEVQKELLAKQMLCLSDNLEFDRAIAVAEKLKAIYVKQNDSINAQKVQARIDDLKATKATLNTRAQESGDDTTQ